MDLINGKKVYVHYDPRIDTSFVEVLTIQQQTEHLLFFEEKIAYYAVEYKEFLFYAYSYNVAGNILITEKKWHLPVARIVEKCRKLSRVFLRNTNAPQYNQALKNEILP